jgi:hypothetical protein
MPARQAHHLVGFRKVHTQLYSRFLNIAFTNLAQAEAECFLNMKLQHQQCIQPRRSTEVIKVSRVLINNQGVRQHGYVGSVI